MPPPARLRDARSPDSSMTVAASARSGIDPYVTARLTPTSNATTGNGSRRWYLQPDVRVRELGRAVSTESNPFEEFNKAMGAGTVQNPYPDFAAMREAHVVPADVRMLLGLDADADLDFDPGDVPPLYTVSSYEAVQEVLRDNVRFSSNGYAEVMGAVMGHTILEMDEPEHHAYRSLIQQAFSRKAMESWETELVGPVVDELIDGFVGEGRADLVSRLLFPFPVNVIAG